MPPTCSTLSSSASASQSMRTSALFARAGILALAHSFLRERDQLDRLLARHRLFQRFAVHPRDGEHPARGEILA